MAPFSFIKKFSNRKNENHQSENYEVNNNGIDLVDVDIDIEATASNDNNKKNPQIIYNEKSYSQDELQTTSPTIIDSIDDEAEKEQGKERSSSNGELKQGLKSRHIQLIALGGTIGTSLLVGTSSALANCGPAGLFISYLIISTFVYPIMNALGEMVCFLPGNGSDSAGSAAHLVHKYVDPSLGFAASWNYYYCFVILVAAEVSAASGVIEYWAWAEHVPKGAWITIFLSLIVILNFLPVNVYGESEFWFASIKILCITGLIILSFILFWGGGPKSDGILGFRYWKNPGSFAHHITGGGGGNFLDIYTGIIKGGFSVILGPELVCLTSSECADQRRNIAKASKRFVWRLMFFYILGSLSIGVIVAYNDPVLQNALAQSKAGAGSSPFVIGIQNAGIRAVPHIVNFCILTSAWSAGNAYMFASSRSLLTMARNGNAPKIFCRINQLGVPYTAVGASLLLSCLAYLNVSSSTADVFNWFSNISTISGFIGWICACVAYIRFRKAITYNKLTHRIPFRAKGQQYTIWYSLFWVSLITLTNGYAIFIPRNWNVKDFIAAYITLPIFIVLWIGHKVFTRTLLKAWLRPIDKIDVYTGLEEIEELTEELNANRQAPKNKWEKFMAILL
ncbi:proline permease PUT4 NDAI_0E03800 [Naumovozyma dairenensis CBS 421]|uniref:Amino acid permease/ SLC12A domain-containing protein n=1 Tax=Naumovozyma dairenensis (strain ATCC 10597 / BCRC 20456 / CBS 421 / NBRC 0211 / NRRL Y-12639) TaxID=1071378 RepID=G0WBS7_NAUDC|nr:hypothetical protein NDAI_0E03800 [Naumovozyma dairenensis CBS 421]CCD25197.1 hypothetical protein NDAI_0E03800 [Naumovozyma dairenensis CBS 421]